MHNRKIRNTLKYALGFALLLASSAVFSGDKVIRLSEPVEKTQTSETFGAPLNAELDKVAFPNLILEPAKYVGKPLQTETEITKVCQKKGCFFIAQHEQSIMRISFKDYAFFIPTDSSGKRVQLSGNIIEKQRSEEQAEHFKQDLGNSADAIKTGQVYEFVADSVRINAD